MAKIRVSMYGTGLKNSRNFSVMWTGYVQRGRKPGLHGTNILVSKGEPVWEEVSLVAADTGVSAVRKPEAGAVEDMEGTVGAYMEMEVDLEANQVTSKILVVGELQVQVAETDLRSTMNMMKEPLLHRDTDKWMLLHPRAGGRQRKEHRRSQSHRRKSQRPTCFHSTIPSQSLLPLQHLRP
jgi:hypothetical protein